MKIVARVKQVASIVLITVAAFIALDFVTSRLPFFRQVGINLHDTAGILRIRSKYYHHDLAPNTDVVDRWGPLSFRVCTDRNGFRCSPEEMGRKDTSFDVAFIGDSFTEGIGYDFAKTFVGLFDARHSDLRVANLGVISYSPSLYYKKVKYYLEQGLEFKHVVVFVDVSDILDEAIRYAPDDSYAHLRPLRKLPMYLPLTSFIGKAIGSLFSKVVERGKAVIDRGVSVFGDQEGRGSPSQPAAPATAPVDPRLMADLSQWTASSDIPSYGEKGVEGAIRQSVDVMTRLKTLLDERGIKLTIGVYPWPGQLYQGKKEHRHLTLWRDFAREMGCGFIDASSCFFDEMRDGNYAGIIEKYYIPGDIHFNEKGNSVIFREIERQFQP